MEEQIVTVEGTKRVSMAEWDEIFRDLPKVDLRGLTPEQLEEKWRNAPTLERLADGSVVLIPAERETAPTETA